MLSAVFSKNPITAWMASQMQSEESMEAALRDRMERVQMGADRHRDQTERDLGHRLEAFDRSAREEIEPGMPQRDAAQDLTRNAGQAGLAGEGAREAAREQHDGEEQERARIVQGVEGEVHAEAQDTLDALGVRAHGVPPTRLLRTSKPPA